MKQSLLALAVTTVLAIGAGIAIAGLPSESKGGDLVITATMASTSTTTVPAPPTTVAATVPSTVESSPPDTVAPSTTESSAPTTTAGTASSDSSSDDSSGDSTSGDTSNGQAATTTTVFEPETLAPEELVVATANATGVSGVATATAERLRPLGYVDVTPVDSVPSATSVVYYQPGLEDEASRVAVALGWGSTSIAPIDEMPVLQTQLSFDLVALVGADQA